jgi:uncharacterized membrane protein YfcA
MITDFLVCCVALVAAAVNAVAGGGTFLVFPALTQWAGLSEKLANIACTVGLWPGSAASALAVRRNLRVLPRAILLGYTVACLTGGTLGAWLLLHTAETTFHYAIPWLLLFATSVFAMGPRISRWAGRETAQNRSTRWTILVGFVQFIIAIYGGYFGAGIGVLTLAGLSVLGLEDIRQINILKVLLSTATNLTAAIVFLSGPVPWRLAGPMAAASAVGGFVGMHAAQRLPQTILRAMILTIASLLTAAFFWKVYG